MLCNFPPPLFNLVIILQILLYSFTNRRTFRLWVFFLRLMYMCLIASLIRKRIERGMTVVSFWVWALALVALALDRF
jgi:hypothetical protein